MYIHINTSMQKIIETNSHEYEKEKKVYMEVFGRRYWKGDMQLYYNLKNKELKLKWEHSVQNLIMFPHSPAVRIPGFQPGVIGSTSCVEIPVSSTKIRQVVAVHTINPNIQ